MGERVAILDGGAQYLKVIDRRVRELNVETAILPLDTPPEQLQEYKAIIISGGPASVYDPNAPKFNPAIFSMGKPVLGICYGMQLMNHYLGGTVEKKPAREDGQMRIAVECDSLLFRGLSAQQRVLLTHGDSLEEIASGFRVIARSEGVVSGIENRERALYGVQFHPEVDLTDNGKTMLRNFLYDVAGFSGDYTLGNREETAIEYIRERVGNEHVTVLVSGGVDSLVLAALVGKALGPKQSTFLHIDNGFLRLNESGKVKRALGDIGFNLHVIDAAKRFYDATYKGSAVPLSQVIDPEVKRKTIGDTFMHVTDEAMRALGLAGNAYIAQGTLRPDLIESASKLASGKADTIKTHHNDSEEVRKLREQGRIIEPLQDYHKDEVRALGEALGLPRELVWRHPFPGPGLAVRILCSNGTYDDPHFAEVEQQVRKFSLGDIKARALPVRTVGVQGDGRSYSYLAALTGKPDWDVLFDISRRMPNEVRGVNRVVYLSGQHFELSDVSITPTTMTPDVIKQLQLADDTANEEMLAQGVLPKLSQVPIVSFPISIGKQGERSIAVRTMITNDFMTGRAAVPGEDIPISSLEAIMWRIEQVPGVSRVAYELTGKPPATTEWE